MGTSQFAVPALEALISSGHELAGIITQPDRPKGRGKNLQPTPVKAAALAQGFSVWQPVSIKAPETVAEIVARPVDLIVVASYGQIIPQAVLEHPRYGCINVHASLLPAYRGAAPIQRAIMDGNKTTGITIMYMEAGLDTGDIILQGEIPIGDAKDHGELEIELAGLGAELLLEAVAALIAGTVRRIPQDSALATYAARLTSEEERLDFTNPAERLHDQVRGLSPVPGAYTILNGKRLKIYATRLEPDNSYYDPCARPGQVVAVTQEGFLVQTGKGILHILQVQKEGKNRMSGFDLARGIPGLTSLILGE